MHVCTRRVQVCSSFHYTEIQNATASDCPRDENISDKSTMAPTLLSNVNCTSSQSAAIASVCSAVIGLFALIGTAVLTTLFTYICTKKHFAAKINRLEAEAHMYQGPLYEEIKETSKTYQESEEMEENPAYEHTKKCDKTVV